MTEATRTGNPFFDAWMDAGRRFLTPGGGGYPLPAFGGAVDVGRDDPH